MQFIPALLLSLIVAINAQTSTMGRYDFQQNDINTLNFALTLEQLEYNFYATGLSNFTQDQFAAAGYNATVYAYFLLIMEHENVHMTSLAAAITARGGTPVTPCIYNFASMYGNSIPTFVGIADVLENTGVSAYDGAVKSITDLDLLAVAATIATIEARHAALLNELVNINPWNNTAFDTPLAPADVVARASRFIVSCPGDPALTSMLPQPAAFALNNVTDQAAQNTNDIHALQFSIFAETLEVSFYTYGLSVLTAQDFTNEGYNASIYATYTQIRQLEAAHLTFLTNTLNSIGGTVPGSCTYNFPAILGNATLQYGNNVSAFLNIADMLQTTGLGSFNGALNTISNLMVRTGAATIATIEGRFTAYNNQIVGKPAFNESAFDVIFTPAQVYAMASPFIVSCNYDVPSTFPVPANFSEAAQITDGVASGSFTTSVITTTSTSTSTAAILTTSTSTSTAAMTTSRSADVNSSDAVSVVISAVAIIAAIMMI